MIWAGARTDGFARFETDFSAERIPLLFNFRSSPDLVRIQHVVAQALDSTVIPSIAQATRKIDGDVAQVWNCPTEDREAKQIAQWIAADMGKRGTVARDMRSSSGRLPIDSKSNLHSLSRKWAFVCVTKVACSVARLAGLTGGRVYVDCGRSFEIGRQR